MARNRGPSNRASVTFRNTVRICDSPCSRQAHVPTCPRAHVRVVSADCTAVLRLREMGIRAGALVRLAARRASGSRIVTIGAARLAIDAATCAPSEVDPA